MKSTERSLGIVSPQNSPFIKFPEDSDASASTESSLVIIEDYFDRPLPLRPGEYCGSHEWEILNSSSKGATTSQLVAALDIVTDILDKENIPYAVMGGFSLQLRGKQGVRHNIDLAVPLSMLNTDESAWLTVFKDELRILRPSVFLSGVKDMTRKTLFVQVGDLDNDDNAAHWVRVDLRFVGHEHSLDTNLDQSLLPVLEKFEQERDLVSSPLSSEKQYHCLKLGYLLHDKLCMIKSSSTKREIDDVTYVLSGHLAEVGDVRSIDMELRTNFLNCYDALSPNDLMTDYFARALWLEGDYLWDRWTAVQKSENSKPVPENKGWLWTRFFRR
ncbi:hypothetical protein GE21DRAFT_5589 [Neurospora crassa]|uniref:Uncharacterized protein n=1 Tax=Neurospora crassa (strain ATCC 24698 / 74-OR23-1A / CBS 708.71 / DSM 1257 / FGSC 987) TaxID=367110 RepID=Q7S846_NEUCR|nr:hypothetical protein NCU06571 [Neurospora crassa OR74A]EAA32505.1 hypothetical protein NCU06571 [Neurospora crassa OR74A]KHE78292.1 hypothetical protein GE21DRAFT_5589 [Neurospora crassa]|eukprot:XP_961741.1 hypothetical protein NCU06571 [Neurospora crassa OR74A]